VTSNIELVRSIYADWERGDFSAADWVHPEIEVTFADGPAPGGWRGRAGFTAAWREFLGTWENVSIRVEEYREVDDQRVLVFAYVRGRGKASRLDLGLLPTEPVCCMLEFRQGQVIRQVFYWDRDRALADLGLAPEGDTP
jgi:ketosteroid isomerase-like protein